MKTPKQSVNKRLQIYVCHPPTRRKRLTGERQDKDTKIIYLKNITADFFQKKHKPHCTTNSIHCTFAFFHTCAVGLLRLPIEQIFEGGVSYARNPKIQNMLRMVGYGENLGSGFPTIISAWKEARWGEPDLKNKIEVDEVELMLPLPTQPRMVNRVFIVVSYFLMMVVSKKWLYLNISLML
jgi:hypothetical protein